MLVELAVVGGIAGLMAAVGAMVVGRIIAQQIFQLEMTPAPWLPLLAAPGGAIVAVTVGWWAMRRLLAVPPLAVLRSGA
jgi:putative ABC transport system permease protein